jgi:hypothetical protein
MSQVQPTSQPELEKLKSSEQLQSTSVDANTSRSDELTDEQLDEVSGGLRTIVRPRTEPVQ